MRLGRPGFDHLMWLPGGFVLSTAFFKGSRVPTTRGSSQGDSTIRGEGREVLGIVKEQPRGLSFKNMEGDEGEGVYLRNNRGGLDVRGDHGYSRTTKRR